MVDGQDNFGPAHNVVEALVALGLEVVFVLHPISSSGTGFFRRFRSGVLVEEQSVRYGRPARVWEALRNGWLAVSDQSDVLVLVDPLNFATAGLLRRLLRRRGLVVYYTADYADRRFTNPLANRLYHGLDRAAIRAAHVVWNVSRPIREKRRRQGVPEQDNVFVPNAASFDPDRIVPFEQRAPESLVMVGALDPFLDDKLLLDTLGLLCAQRPRIRATIVGTGPGEATFRKELGRRNLSENVRLTGHLPRPQALSIVRDCRVGLALYSGRASWNEYRDSVKVREYLSLGVPVVTTGNHPLAAELESRGAGVVVREAQEAASAIDALLGPAGADVAARAAQMGHDYDRDSIMGAVLADLSARLAEQGQR
jgi:glycosyltransferase involved in cell wall biosynthesis